MSQFELLAFGEIKPDFVSRNIQRAIKANYSHVGVLHNGILYHAVGEGTCKVDYELFLRSHTCVVRRRVIIPVRRECCARVWLEARMGQKYSLVQYLGFAFPFLRFIPFINNGRRETVCSEFGADFVCDNSELSAIATRAYGDCDWINPKECLDIAGGIYGEQQV